MTNMGMLAKECSSLKSRNTRLKQRATGLVSSYGLYNSALMASGSDLTTEYSRKNERNTLIRSILEPRIIMILMMSIVLLLTGIFFNTMINLSFLEEMVHGTTKVTDLMSSPL